MRGNLLSGAPRGNAPARSLLSRSLALQHERHPAFERDALFPIAGLSSKDASLYLQVEALVDRLHTVEPAVAREYLDGRLEFERAGAELERAALMAHPEAALLYMNEYRSYVATYTYGHDLVADELQKQSGGDPEAQWKVYAQWMSVDPQVMNTHGEAGKGGTLSHVGGG